jgi:hypothetical protein
VEPYGHEAMDLNRRASIVLKNMLARHGFDVELQQRVPSASVFDDEAAVWGSVAVFRAVWVSTPAGDTNLNDGRPDSRTRPTLYISYRDDLAGTEKVANKRIVYKGLAYALQSSTIEGDAVGLLLALGDGRYIGGSSGEVPSIIPSDEVIDGGEV